MIDRQRLIRRAAEMGIPLTEEQAERIDLFCADVREANGSFNLTALTEPEAMEEKNALDCLTVLPFLPEGGRAADLGTGAGFPGIVIRLCRPELDLTLIEATDKKLRFAAGEAEKFGLPVTAVHLRGEEAARGPLRESFDAVTARAVAPLPALLEYALPLVKPGGVLLAMKGQGAEEEIAASANALRELKGEVAAVHRFTLPTAGERAVVEIRKTGSCPARYPRPGKNIRKKPL